MDIKKIRRNSKKVMAEIFNNATDVKIYTLSNNFKGESVSNIEEIKDLFEEKKHSILESKGNNEYKLYLHSNKWYNFKSI